MKTEAIPRLLTAMVALATLPMGLAIRARSPIWPVGLELEPNAIQDPRDVMDVEVSGVPEGRTVWLQVLRDCDGDLEPDKKGIENCASPLYERRSEAAKSGIPVKDRIDFADLAAEGRSFPTETILWLRAGQEKTGPGLTVRFGLVENPCSLWRSIVDVFLRGECNPGLAQALRQHRGPSDLPTAVFEVRVTALAEASESRPLPGTLGATGVAWRDVHTLLVTVAEPTRLRQGLYQVDAEGGDPVRLWAPEADDDLIPVAPLLLPGDCVAFVRQGHGEQTAVTEEPAAYLHTLRDGRLDEAVELPYKIHQLLAADREGRRVLALTLGVAASKPALLEVDLLTREVRYLGYHHSLYHAAMRSPAGEDAVIAMEDNTGQYGWDLVLVDEKGEWKQDLQNRLGLHELLPIWRPDGRMVAFLAEVEAQR